LRYVNLKKRLGEAFLLGDEMQNLSPLKRRNWGVTLRNNQHWTAAAIALLCALLVAGYASEYRARLAAESYANAIHHAKHLPEMGAPGTTQTDINEGTWFMSKQKKPR